MDTNKKLLDSAKMAIEKLFCDRSVSANIAKGNLELLRDDILMKIDSLGDIEAVEISD